MSLSLVDAQKTEDGFAVTLVSECAVHHLEGTADEMARLAAVMRQVAVLAPLHEGELIWLEDITVGRTVVRLGIEPDGRTRLLLRRA